MSTSNPTGDPVPFAGLAGHVLTSEPIITKRELFATMAMQGLCANDLYMTTEETASKAVACADALIEALNEGKEKP